MGLFNHHIEQRFSRQNRGLVFIAHRCQREQIIAVCTLLPVAHPGLVKRGKLGGRGKLCKQKRMKWGKKKLEVFRNQPMEFVMRHNLVASPPRVHILRLETQYSCGSTWTNFGRTPH